MAHAHANPEDSQLIVDLLRLSKKSPKLVRSSQHAAPADPAISVRSWKMNEFKYYDVPSPFPTLARGLFTTEVDEDGNPIKRVEARDKEKGDAAGVRHRIIARGYDKFFNIGEVPWTTWQALEERTSAPYTLSLKSNGCIIFIAALTPSKLLITSKHSLGSIQGVEETHAQAGERWLRKHVQSKGKTTEQLASKLWENNWTAIAELCDDSFEEHVLPYAPEKSGLHLHGLNRSQKYFATLPAPAVDAFAEEWGFITTLTTTLDSIPDVKAFTDKVGKTGEWRGEPVEGFVVRTHVKAGPPDARSRPPPYAPGATFFFKVKFDEPYMMYRDWREVTRTLLATKGPIDTAKLPKNKMKRAETRVYVEWVKDEIKRDRAQFDGFAKGHGIIGTRLRFLDWVQNTPQGRQAMAKAKGGEDVDALKTPQTGEKTFGKTVIVPVAIPGCGKTAISVALARLFGFGHTQSDDVKAKKPAPIFIKNVTELLKKHNVVIADKNNHLRQHRAQLREATSNMHPPVRLLALNWALDKPHAMLHRVCSDRILARGKNHQALHGDKDGKAHEEVVWMFLRTAEELSDSEVDASVDIDIEADLETMLARAIDACVDIIGVDRPSQERVDKALADARDYVPQSLDKQKGAPKKKAPAPRYFALLPELDLSATVEPALKSVGGPGADFYARLKAGKRLEEHRPHITVVHKNSLPDEQALWDASRALSAQEIPSLFEIVLGSVVWNDRVMAVTVDDVRAAGERQEGATWVSRLPKDVRDALHITLGTREGVPPVEAKSVVKAWRNGDIPDGGEVKLDNVTVSGRLKGLTG